MNKKSYILVYDSGVGGLTTLATIIKKLPKENYIYFADTINCPYGNKCPTKLKGIILDNIKKITEKYNISHIVLACNTATSIAIKSLRELYSIPIIGIEPNICEPSKSYFNNIIVLATPITISQEKLKTLEKKVTKPILNVPCENLAKFIENFLVKNDKNYEIKAREFVKNVLSKASTSSAIVLGCTHYIYLKNYIQNLGFSCFDGNEGIAKRLKYYLNQGQSQSNVFNDHCYKLIIITGSAKLNMIYKKVLQKYKNQLK